MHYLLVFVAAPKNFTNVEFAPKYFVLGPPVVLAGLRICQNQLEGAKARFISSRENFGQQICLE